MPPKWAQDGASAVSGYPFTCKKLSSTAPADKIEPRGTQNTQRDTEHTEHTDAFPTHEVLLRAPLLRAPGARMTVVELTPSNKISILMDFGHHNTQIHDLNSKDVLFLEKKKAPARNAQRVVRI